MKPQSPSGGGGANAEGPRRPRLTILVNTIAPYRVPIYGALAEQFDVTLLHGGGEANRRWQVELPQGVQHRCVWTLQWVRQRRSEVHGVSDRQFMHFNLGLLWWLPLSRPEAIFTNELGLRTAVAVVYGAVAGVPVSVGWEGSSHSERNISWRKRRLRWVFARVVRHWISFGQMSHAYLENLGVTADRITRTQNCVQQELFQPLATDAWNRFPSMEGPILLCVGQLIPRKGLPRLLAACARLVAEGERFSLVLVGDGPERESLREQIDRLGLRNVVLLPHQGTAELKALYRGADCFVFPTLEDVWGLVVNEALWAGLPVLCSVYAGSSEVVNAADVFDPLREASFDAALRRAVRGEVKAEHPGALMTWQEVSQCIADGLWAQLTEGDAAQSEGAPVRCS